MSGVGKPGVLLVNFGGPQGPDELVPFLTNLFDDVLPLPKWLKGFVAPRVAVSRSRKVGPNYEQIGWSPIVPETRRQLEAVRAALGASAPPMAMGMLFTPPTVLDGIRELEKQGCDAIAAVAMFPQYSTTTTKPAYDRVREALASAKLDLRLATAPPFYDRPDYVEALANTIRAGAAGLEGEGPIHLVFSPHGLPLYVVRKGDPYPDQVKESIRLVLERLGWTDPWHLGWQSRVGPVKWLAPSTPEVIHEIARSGGQRVLVVPISFVGEHIETLHELDIELRKDATDAGIRWFGRASAVGVDPAFVHCLAGLARETAATLS